MNRVYVETHRGHHRYDPMIFGQFLEHFHRQVYGGIFEPGSALADEPGALELPAHSVTVIQTLP